MAYIREENIGKISFSTSVLLVVLLTVILGGVFLKEKYDTFQKKLSLVEEIYIQLKKEQLKSDVMIEIERIEAFQKNNPDMSQQQAIKMAINILNFLPEQGLQKEYIFVYAINDLSGGEQFATMLVNPNRPDLINKKVSDIFTDAKGRMFRKEMLEGIRQNQEAFVTYWYKKPGHDGIFQKISYFKYYPKWRWVVAKGSYLDDLDARVAQMQEQLTDEINQTIFLLAIFLTVTCICFLFLAYFFSKRLGLLFEGYKKIQKKHQKKLERLNRILRKQASTDPLTAIHNRAYFNSRLNEEISRSRRYQTPLGLILFDVDYFKEINDTYGHLEGDHVLKTLAHLCLTNIRSSDVLARWGGEEFVILVPESNKDDALNLADKLRLMIEKHHFDRGFQITCSFGVTYLLPKESDDDFINRVDNALYHSKENGKNMVTTL